MERENPTAILSKQLISDSLVDLMQVKPIQEITIKEITENAEVARKTFYRHYSDKMSVLDDYWQSACEELKIRINETGSKLDVPRQTLPIILDFCYEHKAFLSALVYNHMQGYLINKWNVTLLELNSYYSGKIQHFPQTQTDEELNYLLLFNAGGVFNVVMKWIADDMKKPTEELIHIIQHMLHIS